MKKLVKLSCVGILAAGMWVVRGGSEWCDKIGDGDMRNFCIAETKKSPGYCEKIRNDDSRHYCQGIAEKNSAYCDKIGNADMKYYCRARI